MPVRDGMWNGHSLHGNKHHSIYSMFCNRNCAQSDVGVQIITNGDAVIADFNQLEPGAFPTSPILTTTATVARSADAVTVAGALAAKLSAAQGTILLQTNQVLDTNFATDAIFLGANAVNNQILGNFNSTNNKI